MSTCVPAGDIPLGSLSQAEPSAKELIRRSEEHMSELQSQSNVVCRLLLEKKKNARWDMSPSPGCAFRRPARAPHAGDRRIAAFLPADQRLAVILRVLPSNTCELSATVVIV